MKTLLPVMVLLLAGCASTRSTSSKPEAAPEGSPEALMQMLGGGKPTLSPAQIEKHPLGTQKNPVRVGGPGGERAYLARLRCENGEQPKFERIGSFGTGPWGYILDGYNVDCGGRSSTVFMDMYHSQYLENRPVPGFTITPPAPR